MYKYRRIGDSRELDRREQRLKEMSTVMFTEIAFGIYKVEKDREGTYHNFVEISDVVHAMNFVDGALLKTLDEVLYTGLEYI